MKVVNFVRKNDRGALQRAGKPRGHREERKIIVKHVNWMPLELFLLILWWAICSWIVIGFPGCAAGTLGSDESETTPAQHCDVREARYPTTMEEFAHLYAGRGFLVDNVHLGRDLLLGEGREIHPIACGIIRIYRSANGYGTLVVVVEHTLPEPMVVRTGSGSILTIRQFVSIYGHLRGTSARSGGYALPWRVGSLVTPQDVIGYVQVGSLNGDGAEHLHLGIRLQNAREAELSDASWFRGYDATPSQRRWFADPATFLPQLLHAVEGTSFTDASVDASVPFDAGVAPPVSSMDAGVRSIDASLPTADHPAVDSSVMDVPPVSGRDAGLPPAATRQTRYEFRVRSDAGWNATSPFRLRNQWWASQVCRNTGVTEPEHLADGWVRCDLPDRVTPFDGSFYTPLHPDWGDAGQLGTVANTPDRCTPTRGAEWRLTDLSSGRLLFEGPVSGLRCIGVGTQDRLILPE